MWTSRIYCSTLYAVWPYALSCIESFKTYEACIRHNMILKNISIILVCSRSLTKPSTYLSFHHVTVSRTLILSSFHQISSIKFLYLMPFVYVELGLLASFLMDLLFTFVCLCCVAQFLVFILLQICFSLCLSCSGLYLMSLVFWYRLIMLDTVDWCIWSWLAISICVEIYSLRMKTWKLGRISAHCGVVTLISSYTIWTTINVITLFTVSVRTVNEN